MLRELTLAMRELRQGCADAGWNIKWIAPPNLHIVLRHLGEISVALPGPIKETLQHHIDTTAPLELEARGLRPHKLPNEEQVVTVGLGGDLERLAELREWVEKEMSGLGFKPEPWSQEAHLIAGRVVSAGEKPLDEILGEVAEREFGLFLSRELVLYRSDIVTPKGEFARLWHLPLGGEADEARATTSPSPSPNPVEATGGLTPRPS